MVGERCEEVRYKRVAADLAEYFALVPDMIDLFKFDYCTPIVSPED